MDLPRLPQLQSLETKVSERIVGQRTEMGMRDLQCEFPGQVRLRHRNAQRLHPVLRHRRRTHGGDAGCARYVISQSKTPAELYAALPIIHPTVSEVMRPVRPAEGMFKICDRDTYNRMPRFEWWDLYTFMDEL